MRRPPVPLLLMILISGLSALPLRAVEAPREKTEQFARDPGWDARNNRLAERARRTVRQDFGYSRTAHAGGGAGEVGGWINPAAEPAYYGAKIGERSFAQPLSASGTLACTTGKFHALLGFFNAGTLDAWRTPNTLCLRLIGRGDCFYAYLEYANRSWQAGGDSPRGFTVPEPAAGKAAMRRFALNMPHRWSLTYDPDGNQGAGALTAAIDDAAALCHVEPAHRTAGGTVDHFGFLPVMKQWDDGGELWIDDVTINGKRDRFDRDPAWDGLNNRRSYATGNVRPAFDFGYSATRFAGGNRSGELGGLVFRGDCRYPDRMACYGDRLDLLTLDKPLRASGRMALRRGVSDSTTLFGFFNGDASMETIESQKAGLPRDFLGFAIEGPSSEGFYFYPAYRSDADAAGSGYPEHPPRVLPDGKSHAWSLTYRPEASGGGRIDLTLDDRKTTMPVSAAARRTGARFNRFGLVTTLIDGNGQLVYFDDLTYTAHQ